MPFSPDAFLIGGEKCGTTTLVDLLEQHPMVTVSRPRDSDYFTRNFGRGADWYRSLFDGSGESIYLDVSLRYSCAPLGSEQRDQRAHEHLLGTPQRIVELSPGARFIYVLRDPVARTYSSYWHAVRHGQEDRPFREAVETHWRYLDQSDYCAQIELYLEVFDLSRILFLLFDDLTADPLSAARQCFRFLDAAPDTPPLHFESPKNRSFRYNWLGRGLRGLVTTSEQMEALVNRMKALVPSPLRPLAKRVIASDIPPIAESDRCFLSEHFRPRVARLEKLIGVPLDHWQA